MKAVVLVGGQGTRLRPLTSNLPKPLLPVAGVPMIERQLTWLATYGVNDVVLSLGYLPDAFVEHFPDHRYTPPGSSRTVSLTYAVESEPLGTAGAIRFAAEHVGIEAAASEQQGCFVVCNGDVLTTLDLDVFVAFHRERGASATIQLAHVEDPSALGAVPTYDDGEVQAFVEKPAPGTSPSNWINAGTYVLDPSVLALIPSGRAVSIERETFPSLLGERGRVYAMGTDDYWIDVGTPQTYLDAHVDVLSGRLGSPPLHGAQETAPGVWLCGDVNVSDTATLEPPVLIADGASVAANARVSSSTIGAGASVGPNAIVESSVLHAGARVADGAFASMSILGSDAVVDAGASISACTIVGAQARVAAGTTLVEGRVPVGAVSE